MNALFCCGSDFGRQGSGPLATRRREQRARPGDGNERPQRRQQAQDDAGSNDAAPRQDNRRQQQRNQAQQPAEGSEDKAPVRRQNPAAEASPERPRAQQARPESDAPRSGNQRKPATEAPAADGTSRERPAVRPQRDSEIPQPDSRRKPGSDPRETDANPRTLPAERTQQDGDTPRRTTEPRQNTPAGERPDATTAAPSETPARSGGERPRRQAPVAQDGEQPRLPVENGAAVLDSAKEPSARQRDRQRDGERDGQRPRREQSQQSDAQQVAPPRSDADAQAGTEISREQREQWRNQRRQLAEERGERLDRRPDFERPRGWDVRGPARGGDRDRDRDRDGGRVIISIDNQEYVRHNDSRRFYRDGREPEYERLGDGRYREVVERDDGTRVITIRNRYGEVVQRSRVVRGGDEYVLYYAPELLEDRRDYVWRDPGEDLPPMRLTVPVEDYIIDTSSEPDRDYYEFLEQPPVERVERVYSLDEVRYSARIRDKVPRIDLDTITFATGSAEIPMNQAGSLRKVADAINKVLQKDPSETFLIEGHTDAVGSDQDNLVLSDQRAESVAVVLADAFGIPPENLTTQGYGEQYLKVQTDAPNQENRRVTIRRITPLVKPVASAQ
eukprot:g7753.t1